MDFLDIDPRLQIAKEIFDQPERFDQQLFELFTSHHAFRVRCVRGAAQSTGSLWRQCVALDRSGNISERYDFVVVDLPVPWFRWTVPVLENSDKIIVTGLNTIPGLRQMNATLAAVANAKGPSSQLAVVINRTDYEDSAG